jgi:hypothetical protein
MKKPRHNIFNQLHTELRSLLSDTSHAVGRTDFTQPAQVRRAFNKIDDTLRLFDIHTKTEEEHLFPLLNSFAPDIVMDFEQQHQEDKQLSIRVRHIMQSYCISREQNGVEEFGQRLLQAFESFAAFNLAHMKKDETVINEALWQHYADQDLVALEHAITGYLPPEQRETVY